MNQNITETLKKLGPLIGLIALFIIIAFMNDSFLEFSNLRNYYAKYPLMLSSPSV